MHALTVTVHPRQNVTRAAEGLDRRRFTIEDVEAMVAAGVMGEDERVELIGGELVPMSPKGDRHEVLKMNLNRKMVQRRAQRLRHPPGDDLPPLR